MSQNENEENAENRENPRGVQPDGENGQLRNELSKELPPRYRR